MEAQKHRYIKEMTQTKSQSAMSECKLNHQTTLLLRRTMQGGE